MGCVQIGVHVSSMNIRKVELIAYIYIHLSLIPEAITFTTKLRIYTQFVLRRYKKAMLRKRRSQKEILRYCIDDVMTLTTSNHIDESHGFL